MAEEKAKTRGKLVLKNGPTFEGEIFGAEAVTSGEVVFTTGMVGYPESLTDPSFKDQILTFTSPLIGNYGIPEELEDEFQISQYFESSQIHLKGIVVSEYSENYHHWNAKKSLSDFLKNWNIPGISGIDTRALTQFLRDNGSTPGKIIPENNTQEFDFYDPNFKNLVAEVSTKEIQVYGNGLKTIVILDCGVKNNTLRNFLRRNIRVIRVPWNYDFFAEPILDTTGKPYVIDGIFISNGPGDPSLLEETVQIIQKAFALKMPTLGICLGNQLMGIAAGAKTYKLKFGHRGQNQPCMNTETERCFMTSQNHGFAIDPSTLPSDWKTLFININDQTIEGIKHVSLPFFASQFHPEAFPGPTDTEYLFDEFANLL